ncbi:MAG: hypothetical protein Q9180_008222, partial [Flavoplaca navasiana]
TNPELLSHRDNAALESLGVLQGTIPRLCFLRQDDHDKEKIFVIEQRSSNMIGGATGDNKNATSLLEERVIGIPIASGDCIEEDWYDATVPYHEEESWIRCLGSRIVIVDTADDFSTQNPVPASMNLKPTELAAKTSMMNATLRISRAGTENTVDVNLQLGIGSRTWPIASRYRRRLNSTRFLQGDDKWVIATSFKAPRDREDRKPFIVAYFFDEAKNIMGSS